MKFRTSPEKGSFWQQYLDKAVADGRISKEAYIQFCESNNRNKSSGMNLSNEFKLENDLRSNEYIRNKCLNSEQYCEDLYAGLCNNEFTKDSIVCSYSWRTCGGIIADILEKGDYIDWYLSGNEGVLSKEIKDDLELLGWKPVQEE